MHSSTSCVLQDHVFKQSENFLRHYLPYNRKMKILSFALVHVYLSMFNLRSLIKYFKLSTEVLLNVIKEERFKLML